MRPVYFATANFWLALAATAFLGKKQMRSQPDQFALFGVGQWLDRHEYTLLLAGMVTIAVVCLVLFGLSCRATRE